MKYAARQPRPLLIAALAMLALRALTPAGYMPGSPDSGLLYELCPSGMPAEIMRALGGGHHQHHHHEKTGGMAGDEQCPIGHMLAAAVAMDSLAATALAFGAQEIEAVPFVMPTAANITAYRSRAPPA